MAGLGALIIFLLWAPLSLSQFFPGGWGPASFIHHIHGGWGPADKNSKAVLDIAEFCVSQYNTKSDGNLSKVICLEDASQQVVNGMNYKLTMVLVQTECTKDYKNRPDCDKSSSSKVLQSLFYLHVSFMSCKSNVQLQWNLV
ncbi:cystatin 10-like [Rana temporaria]|uniref:cystatin 10-like n=1 Tax=Rana temporaria TaxID=8407 RepID=UPI001AAE1620|nr:cystatin 10-like [Rana temporaria]